MKKPIGIAIIAIVLTLALSACSAAPDNTAQPPQNPPETTSDSGALPADAGDDATDLPVGVTIGSFTLDEAKAEFSVRHPNADISVAKLEGDVYYIEGWEGSTVYKMKFSVYNGDIYLDKTIPTGRPAWFCSLLSMSFSFDKGHF